MMYTPTMTVLLVAATPPASSEAFPSALLDVPFRLVPTTPDAALDDLERERRTGRTVDGVLLDLAGLPADEAVSRAARLARGCAVPVVTRGDLDVLRVLELAALGVADHLPAGSPPEQWLGRLLLAQDRWQTERELQRGYVAFRSIFRSLDHALAITDLEGRLEEGNPALCELLAIPAEQLASHTVESITHPEDRGTLDLLRELAAGRRRSYRVRKRYVGGDGRVLWCEARVSRFHDPLAGSPRLIAELINVTPEVTTRRQLDRARSSLDAVREDHRLLFERTPLPTLLLDLETFRLTDANPAACDLLGYSREELLELAPERLWEPPEQLETQGRRLLSEDRELAPVGVRLRHRDGAVLAVEMTSVRLRHGPRPTRALLLRDDGRRELSRQTFDRAREVVTLQKAAFDVARLVEGLGIRTVEAAGRLRAHLGDDDRALPWVERLRRIGGYAGALARQLDGPQLGEGRGERLELCAALTAVTAELARRLPGGFSLRLHSPEPPLPVQLSRGALRAILGHLVDNARDAMPGGGEIEIAASRETTPEGEERVCVAVADHGPGVAAAALPHIFEPFYTTRESSSGLGLGLPFAVWLLRRGGGELRVESSARGTRLLFDLPLLPEAREEEQADAVHGAKVLVIDDDPAVRFVLEEMLRGEGCRVVATGDAATALDRLRDPSRFDLVVTDATLPGLSSKELMEHLEGRTGPRVLVVSGYLNDTLAARGLLGSDVPFLTKPFTSAELSAKLREILPAAQG